MFVTSHLHVRRYGITGHYYEKALQCNGEERFQFVGISYHLISYEVLR